MKRQKEHASPGNQRTKKQEDNVQSAIFDFINKKSYILSPQELNIILNSPRLPSSIFSVILDNKTLDKLSIGDILEKYEYFTKRQLAEIKRYIHIHLNDENLLFVSDLIDCANWNNIESNIIFDFCIDTIRKRRSSSIVLSAILYIFEHMRITQSVVVVPIFNQVIKNKSYYQNCQIIAAFCLFRITMNPNYLRLIKNMVSLDNTLYTVLINKMFLLDYCRNNDCFFYRKDDFS